jgi:hypothetical protein
MMKNLDKWANDATLPAKTAKQQKAVQEATFREFKRLGMTPDSIRDKEVGQAYAAWLATQTQQ